MSDFHRDIDRCMLFDQPRLRRRVRGLKRARNRKRAEDQIRQDVKRSITRRSRREANRPKPAYPADLPIAEKKDEIAAAIREHQVIVLCGETGSGKTTQLPKICLEIGRGAAGMIGHTQPRRIAARSVATRIAEELASPVGRHVGYKMRFTDTVGEDCFIKIMTDGILLAETRSDRFLHQYDTIIIDEAHERSLNIDFLIGYLKRLLPKRPDLKVIITSATIDPERFSEHFDGAPIINVTGRTYPVEVRYRPLVTDDPDEEDFDQERAIVAAVDELAAIDNGDILIFLSSEREILEMSRVLRGRRLPGASTEVLPLYARLSAAEQQRVFAPHKGRRIVLATNVAETSITVPGIRYVIDTGFARVSRYSARSGVQRLPIEPISRASAEQRAGRCGRLAPGICIRLYSEEDFQRREEYTPPEILRTNLASVILQMTSLGLGDIEDFPFIAPPKGSMITDARKTLEELGALDAGGEITETGRCMARLPIDPRLARMLLEACDEGCLAEVLIITAALAIQDPRERPAEAREQADEAHARFADLESDFFTLINLWNFYREKERELSGNRLRKLCRQHFLSYMRMREWREMHRQLRHLLRDSEIPGARMNREPAKRDAIHRAVLSGLLSRIGMKGDGHEYTGAHNRRFHIFPGSSVFKTAPKWIMAGELIETARLYAHDVAKIQSQWIEPLARHLVKRSHHDPHFSTKTGRVMAYETITLFGLEIVSRRRVHYGPVAPAIAREIFIREGLVEENYRTNAPFAEHNHRLVSEMRTLEYKARRRDLLADEVMRFAFYDDLIPEDVWSGKRFEAWRRRAEKKNPTILHMRREDLLVGDAAAITPERYPDSLRIGHLELALEYLFEPGHEEDGITVIVPRIALGQLSGNRLAWLVPGLLEEKIAALLKTLPKHLRRNFVPAPDFARACAANIAFGEGSLTDAIARYLHAATGIDIPRDAWSPDELPRHLMMNVRVVDEEESTLAQGRDLVALREQFGEPIEHDATGPHPSAMDMDASDAELAAWHRDGITAWDFDDLPEQITIRRPGVDLTVWPALVDRREYVSLRPFDAPELVAESMRGGLARLIMLTCPDEMRHLGRMLPDFDRLAVAYTGLGHGDAAALRDQWLRRAVERAFLPESEIIRTRRAFHDAIEHGWLQTETAVRDVGAILDAILCAQLRIESQLARCTTEAIEPVAQEIDEQIETLLEDGFLLRVPWVWLTHMPRYMQGIEKRLEKVFNGRLTRDREAAVQFNPRWQAFRARRASHHRQVIVDPQLDHYGWMLEEWRVALFAQELGTAMRVSERRLDEQWARVCD